MRPNAGGAAPTSWGGVQALPRSALQALSAGAFEQAAERLEAVATLAEALRGRSGERLQEDVTSARCRLDGGAADLAWAAVLQAIAGLPVGFPPDPASYPPPGTGPFTATRCRCGTTLAPTARFCPSCGSARA